MEFSSLPLGEDDTAEKRFAPKFSPGWTSTQSHRSVVVLAIRETNEYRGIGVIDKDSQPFRTQLIVHLDDSLIGLIDGPDHLD
jgi:hypothetical protein